MLRKSLIAIAMLSLLMTAAALAQPAQKRLPSRKSGIWGMETDFGAMIKRPRVQTPANVAAQIKGRVHLNGIGGGAAGGALIGVVGTKTPRTAHKP